jgi:hypothetical protein
MNENRMNTSTNTGEVSLPSAKESGLDRKSSNIGPMSPNGYLVRLGNGLPTGQRWRESSENSEKYHLETVNFELNGKSRIKPNAKTTNVISQTGKTTGFLIVILVETLSLLNKVPRLNSSKVEEVRKILF